MSDRDEAAGAALLIMIAGLVIVVASVAALIHFI